MEQATKLYIANMGMITAIGANVAMTAMAVNAGISAYKTSADFVTSQGKSITMAAVPNSVFDNLDATIAEGDRFNERHDRMTKMAIIAIREACQSPAITEAIPLVLSMPELQVEPEQLAPLSYNLEHNCTPWVSTRLCRQIHSGRAAGIEAIDFAFNYLLDAPQAFVLVGGSDSHQDSALLRQLDEEGRLLVSGNADGFAPGEAASFLLLTRHPELALQRNGHIISLYPPGIAEEPGYLRSKEPYRGEGLDQAFKKALVNQPEHRIHSIYSSMNGEHHWAKECGVAQIRNKKFFRDPVKIQHPADCYGDLGSATATALIILAAEHLFKSKAQAHLVYSSSDGAKRGAIVVEKIAVATAPNT